jgi:hypothetical protein
MRLFCGEIQQTAEDYLTPKKKIIRTMKGVVRTGVLHIAV